MEDPQLTPLQHEVLRILWRRGPATVSQVQADLASLDRGLAPTTVATLLRRLAKRGIVEHHKEGRHFVFQAAVAEETVRDSMLADLTQRLFEGDVSELVAHLLDRDGVRPGDLGRVAELIAQKQKELEEDGHAG